MDIYLVGGAVRDKLLDLPCSERDWVVLGASPQDMLEAGFVPVESGFPVFLHPESGEEYALARRETKTGPGYKGFEVYTGPDVTLDQDLARRDLTINAIAQDSNGRLIDPFDGQGDLAQGLLRHVSPAFVEDPVRLLRVARFAARLGRWGFRVAHGTHGLMKRMAQSEDLNQLRPERLWREMKKALGEAQPWRFFEVLQRCGALQVLLPRLAASMEATSGHNGEAQTAPMGALRRATEQEAGPVVGFAVAMLYAVDSEEEARALADRLCIEKEYRELWCQLVTARDTFPRLAACSAETLMDFTLLAARPGEGSYRKFILCCEITWPDVAEEAKERIGLALAALRSVSPRDLMDRGFKGKALGKELRMLRLRAVHKALNLQQKG